MVHGARVATVGRVSKHVRGAMTKVMQAGWREPLEGRTPREPPAASELNGSVQPQGTHDGTKAQKPVLSVSPFAFGRVDARMANGKWASAAVMPWRPPRGESSEG